jgi:hypothetical protein
VAALVDDGGDDAGDGDEDDPTEVAVAQQVLRESKAGPEDERGDLRDGGERGDSVTRTDAGAVSGDGSGFGGGDCGAGLSFPAGD